MRFLTTRPYIATFFAVCVGAVLPACRSADSNGSVANAERAGDHSSTWSPLWSSATSGVKAGCAGIARGEGYRGSASGYLEITEGYSRPSAELEQYVSARSYIGKRISIEAYLTTSIDEGFAGRAFLEVELDPGHDPVRRCQSHPGVGRSEWRKVAIVLDVPENTRVLRISTTVHEVGKAWVDNIKILDLGQSDQSARCQDSLENRGLYGSHYDARIDVNKVLANGDFEGRPSFQIADESLRNCFAILD